MTIGGGGGGGRGEGKVSHHGSSLMSARLKSLSWPPLPPQRRRVRKTEREAGGLEVALTLPSIRAEIHFVHLKQFYSNPSALSSGLILGAIYKEFPHVL